MGENVEGEVFTSDCHNQDVDELQRELFPKIASNKTKQMFQEKEEMVEGRVAPTESSPVNCS